MCKDFEPDMTKQHVIICGMIPDERILKGRIPHGWEVWCINSMPTPPKWDRWFQLHGLGHITEKHGISELDRLAQLSKRGKVYLFPKQIERWHSWHKEITNYDPNYGDFTPMEHNFREFPVEQLCEWSQIRYYTGSFAYLVSFADYLGFTGIHFASIDLWYDPRQPHRAHEQWAVSCVEFHMGRAQSHGVKFYPESQKTGLMHDVWEGLYGYEAGGEY